MAVASALDDVAGTIVLSCPGLGGRRALHCSGRSSSRGGRRPSRKVRTSQGKVIEISTRGNPRESATETNRRRRPSHVNGRRARGKWCGKSAPASRRRDGWANPTRCKAKRDRLQAARRGPGRPLRWMAARDRIRLTDLLRKSPAPAGFFYGPIRWVL